MPDISLCLNEDCKLKMKCYRYTATPNEWRQSYTFFKPDSENSCQYFLPQTKTQINDKK
jgi:hypothetical protein